MSRLFLGSKAWRVLTWASSSDLAIPQRYPQDDAFGKGPRTPVPAPSVDDLDKPIKLEGSGDERLWLTEPENASPFINKSASVTQQTKPVEAVDTRDTVESCGILEPGSEPDDYIPKHEISSDSSEDSESNKCRTPTPPLSSLDAIKRIHWPRQHPGTPPPTPMRKKAATPSSSVRSTPSSQRLQILFPNLRSNVNTTLSHGKRRVSKINVSPSPSSKRQIVGSADDDFWREKTPPQRRRINTRVIPLTPPTPKKPSSKQKPTAESKPRPVSFHFSLGNASLGIISKSFEQCSTFEAFNEEAARATGYLSQARSEVEPDLLVADIDGGERRLPVGWMYKHSYDRFCDTIEQATRNGGGPLNVKVYCLRKGIDDSLMPPFFE